MKYRLCLALTLLSFTASSATRARLEEGARLRQSRLSSSNLHTCAVLDDGTVRCWGDNTFGQVGDGTNATPKLAAVKVSGLANIISVSAGYSHTCAVHAFGAVFCWGANTFGELGDGTSNNNKFTPVQAKGIDSVTAVAAGGGFTCALRSNGTVWCWGGGTAGQLGNGTSGVGTQSLTPVQVKTSAPAIAITAGQNHACALLLDSTAGAIVQCWGNNAQGQLGDGTFRLQPTPVTVGGLSNVVDIAAGERHTCALLALGNVQCWGYNGEGQIGNGASGGDVGAPAPVVVNARFDPMEFNAVAVSAGGNHSCAILVDGSLRCWGDDTFGQLGDTKMNNVRPIADTPVFGLNDALEIVTGNKHTCAVETVNFTGRCWGDNSAGQLGNGLTNPASVPNTVAGVPGSTGIGARGIRAGNRWTCARRGNGTLACWGGTGSTPAGPNPVAIAGLSDALSLGLSSSNTCAVESSGDINCFDDATRQPIPLGTSFKTAISFGVAHSCELFSYGTPVCAGSNSRGQTGFNGTPSIGVLNQLGGAVMVAAGAFHTCALIVDGTVYCWGDNTAGQLGNGTVGGISNYAVQVQGLNNIVAISAGTDPGSGGLGTRSFMCALSATGTVSCWGAGAGGQLGNGSINPTQSVAQAVFGITNAVAIAAGGSHACAVLADGSAKCWGSNSSLQLGARDTTPIQTTPVPVISSIQVINGLTFAFSLSPIAAISAGTSHTCAIVATGQPLCWGDNAAGEIGDGATGTPVARPTAVNSFTANVDPAVSLKPNGRIALVTALMNCPTGGEAHISLTLQQGQVSGAGNFVAGCEGGLVEVPLTVPAQGPAGFQTGPANATVEAVVKDQGVVTEDQHWTRAVTLSIQP